MKRQLHAIGLVALCALALPACSASGATRDAQRGATMRMHDDALERAILKWPILQDQIDSSHGYAVVNSGVLKVFFLGLSSGYGVVVDQNSRTHTMIDTFSIAIGPGIELSNTNGIVVFHSRAGLDAALSGDIGWLFGATASAGLEFGDVGGDVAVAGISGETSSYRDMRYGIGLHAQFFGLDADIDEDLK